MYTYLQQTRFPAEFFVANITYELFFIINCRCSLQLLVILKLVICTCRFKFRQKMVLNKMRIQMGQQTGHII